LDFRTTLQLVQKKSYSLSHPKLARAWYRQGLSSHVPESLAVRFHRSPWVRDVPGLDLVTTFIPL